MPMVTQNRQTQGRPEVTREQGKHYSLISGPEGAYKEGGLRWGQSFLPRPFPDRMNLLVLAALLTGRQVSPVPPTSRAKVSLFWNGVTGHRDGQTWNLLLFLFYFIN